MKFCYADPPYIGQAKRHYADDPQCAEVDHARLIADLAAYDAWALSLSSPTLKIVLPLCPDGVRIGAWVKPFASFKPNVNPAYTWEPVIFHGGRKRDRWEPKVRDYVSVGIMPRPGQVHGAKPDPFCWWVFEMLGATPDDEFHDLFPGSGAVSRAWQSYCRSRTGFPLFADGMES